MSSLLLLGEFDLGTFCNQAKDILQFVGWIITVFKIAIPMVIVCYGIFDFGQAVVGSKDDDIKKSAKRLMYRALAGAAIFFIPTVVLWLFGAIGSYSETINNSGGFKTCQDCILTPWSCH